MRTKIILLVLAGGLFLSCTKSFAQESKKKIEIIKKDDYFNDKGKKTSGANDKLNLIKIDPIYMPFFEGEFGVFYERKVSDNVSAELGVGATFSFYLYDLLHQFDVKNVSSVLGDDNATIKGDGTGYSIRGQLKYYFDASDYPEGFYMSLALVHKTYPIAFSGTYNSSGSFSGSIPYTYQFTNVYNNFLICIGSQKETIVDNLYMEWTFGVGLSKNTTGEIVKVTDPNYGSVIGATLNSNSGTGFAYMLSYKLGYAF